MPTYEYKCDACGAQFERFQSITAEPIKRCPECGKAKVRRLIGTGAGLIFKGSGFYITDYRDSSYKDKAKAESGSSSAGTPSDAPSNGKSETKAAGSDAAAGSSNSSTKSNTAGTTAAPAKSESKPAPRSDSAKAKKK